MPIKERELKIRKFYLLAWIFGLLSIFCVWRNWFLAAGIWTLCFIAYSRADYMTPPIKKNDKPDDDSGGLAA